MEFVGGIVFIGIVYFIYTKIKAPKRAKGNGAGRDKDTGNLYRK